MHHAVFAGGTEEGAGEARLAPRYMNTEPRNVFQSLSQTVKVHRNSKR